MKQYYELVHQTEPMHPGDLISAPINRKFKRVTKEIIMTNQQMEEFEKLLNAVNKLPLWTNIEELPEQEHFEPTGFIMIWWEQKPYMVDRGMFDYVMHGESKPECWCKVMPPKPEQIKNYK